MAKYVSEKIKMKSGARLAAVQACYMAAFGQLSVDEVIEELMKIAKLLREAHKEG